MGVKNDEHLSGSCQMLTLLVIGAHVAFPDDGS